MTGGNGAVLRVGDRIRFDGVAQAVVGLSGTLVRLADEHGQTSVIRLPHLLADPSFERIGQRDPGPLLPPGVLSRLPVQTLEEAEWWERHVVEVLTGRPPDAPPDAWPRPPFDPETHTLRQREQAKAEELAGLGHQGVTARTVKRKRLRYQAQGLAGLVDWRDAPARPVQGRTDPRVLEALGQAIEEATDKSTRTTGYFYWRVAQLLTAQHGAGMVPMPSRATFYRLFDRLSQGRHTTGSARTRRSLANRPDGPFGEPAGPASWWRSIPPLERTLESVATLFAQFVAGYVGRSSEFRGRKVDDEPLWSLLELQDLLDAWIVAEWQNRQHDGLRDPVAPGRAFTPNEKYAALIEAAGYVPVALSATDYIELLPARWQAINAYGVKLNHRTYDSADLNRFRRQRSGVTAKKDHWEVHHDPYDVSRIWVRNHWDGGWIMCFWKHLRRVPVPFGELAWDHARHDLADRGEPVTETAIADAVAALLDKASHGPVLAGDSQRTASKKAARKGQRVAARTRATAPARPDPDPGAPLPPGPAPGKPDDEAGDAEIAEVVPLPVFNAREEAAKWW